MSAYSNRDKNSLGDITLSLLSRDSSLTLRFALASGDLRSVKSFCVVHFGPFLGTTLVGCFLLTTFGGEAVAGLGLFELRAERRAMLGRSVPGRCVLIASDPGSSRALGESIASLGESFLAFWESPS